MVYGFPLDLLEKKTKMAEKVVIEQPTIIGDTDELYFKAVYFKVDKDGELVTQEPTKIIEYKISPKTLDKNGKLMPIDTTIFRDPVVKDFVDKHATDYWNKSKLDYIEAKIKEDENPKPDKLETITIPNVIGIVDKAKKV